MDPSVEVPGTGMTVGELQANYGYSDTDIQSLFSSGDIPTTGLSATAYGPSVDSTESGGGNSGWVSGLTDFLHGVAPTITGIVRSISPPKAGTTLYNPQTGLPYGIDPKTGKPVAAAQTMNLVTIGFYVLIGVAVIWAVRHL